MNTIKKNDNELICDLICLYHEQNKVPTARDVDKSEICCSSETYRKRFGSFKDSLIKANLYHLRCDKHNFNRSQYTREEITESVRRYIKKHNKPPTISQLKESSELPSPATIDRNFGSLNKLLVELGINPPHVKKSNLSNKELLDKLIKLNSKLGRQPTYKDVEKHLGISRSLYYIRFGGIYKALNQVGLLRVKRGKFHTNSDLIAEWYTLKENLGRIPTLKDIENCGWNFYSSIVSRWDSYTNFLKILDEDQNYNKFGCKTYISNEGIKCFSYGEYIITNWLENKGILFKKDYPYKNVMPHDNSRRTFDWMIKSNDNLFYIELFGITNVNAYDMKAKDKIEDCKMNKINLIPLYPKDLKRPLNEVFYFL
ncbi:homing endonuclease associated repeat-containing protein [Halobacillus litoralis]|uniref:homing endonuclease associated repeat-containing protein n=1 Tax=Halobacillus litoralis TaxID=45668 RepID=UPI001CD5DE0A|nr:hypothetical protein [Halobacillus litoralis]MCA1021662.1 hypothetical protein [Halobacillus litoralis]